MARMWHVYSVVSKWCLHPWVYRHSFSEWSNDFSRGAILSREALVSKRSEDSVAELILKCTDICSLNEVRTSVLVWNLLTCLLRVILGRVVCNTGMEPAESELRIHESIILSLLVHETVAHDSRGHKKEKDDTELQEQWAMRQTELEQMMMTTFGDVSP